MTHSIEDARVLRLSAQGRTVIPADFRRALGVREGDELVAWLEGEQLIISTRRAVAAHTKGILRDLGEGVVDDLIAERRAEARREEQESRALRKQLQENRRDDGP